MCIATASFQVLCAANATCYGTVGYGIDSSVHVVHVCACGSVCLCAWCLICVVSMHGPHIGIDAE